ncbi:MAG: HAD hydrolase family protein [Bacteroidales bacterium]|nr:HAD hydrolase family protein [Bacteroidales bacterium]
MNEYEEILKNVTTFIFDYDGVMTDGTVYMDSNGDPLRTSNVKDGYAIQLASKLGYHLAVISGAVVTNITKRLNVLGVHDVYIGIPDKVVKLEEYMALYGLKPEQIVYVGDDIPDIPVMRRVGVAACPADAAPEIRQICHFVSDRPGGKGCVRDIIEQTLKVQGKWMTADAYSW